LCCGVSAVSSFCTIRWAPWVYFFGST